jgi:hypothetical protein
MQLPRIALLGMGVILLASCGAGSHYEGRDPVGERAIEELEDPFVEDLISDDPQLSIDEAYRIVGQDHTHRERVIGYVPISVGSDATIGLRNGVAYAWQYKRESGGFIAPLIGRASKGHVRAYNFVLVFDRTPGVERQLVGMYSQERDVPFGGLEVNLEQAVDKAIQFAQVYFLYQIAQASMSIDDSVAEISDSAGRIANSAESAEGVILRGEAALDGLPVRFQNLLDDRGAFLDAIEEEFGGQARDIMDAVMN